MRLSPSILIFPLLAACGSDPATTSTATDSGSGSTTTPQTTTSQEPTTTSNMPTDVSGTAGMTDSGTTTATTPATTTLTTTTEGDSSTTTPVQTDTGPAETTTSGSTTTTGPAETTTSGTTTSGTTTTGDDTTTSDDTTTAVEGPCPCPDLEVGLDDGIFVLSINAELWKFFPEGNNFEKLGPLTCNLPPNTFSMAVDRSGYAWVQYATGALRKIAVTDVSDCTDPNYPLGQTAVANFGMAFVSNNQIDVCDRIYGNTASGIAQGNNIADLFSIDPMTLQAQQIGKSDWGTAEVTGTGDGRLFFFAGANPAKLVEIDKLTGDNIGAPIPLAGVELGSAWAFAFFAGDFYFFTNSKGGPGSEVTHIDYDDSDMNGQKDITVVIPDAPISIVGAGVSTCAPVAPQ